MATKTVFNYETARWLEVHKKHRAASTSAKKVDDQRMQQLREMFNSLDTDGGGEIEIGELQIAMSFLGLNQEQERILEQFDYMDADHSGSIDFDEFCAVMSSDHVDQEFFLLKDEKEAQKWNLSFFLFATSYRRKKIIEAIEAPENATTDAARFAMFHSLFTVPMFPPQDEEALHPGPRQPDASDIAARRVEAERCRIAKDRLLERGAAERFAKIAPRSPRRPGPSARSRRPVLHERHNPPVVATSARSADEPEAEALLCPAPFHMHAEVVPREAAHYDGGRWAPGPWSWDLVRNRSVSLEIATKKHAIRDARRTVGRQQLPFAKQRRDSKDTTTPLIGNRRLQHLQGMRRLSSFRADNDFGGEEQPRKSTLGLGTAAGIDFSNAPAFARKGSFTPSATNSSPTGSPRAATTRRSLVSSGPARKRLSVLLASPDGDAPTTRSPSTRRSTVYSKTGSFRASRFVA